jgi:hypothetical protein
MRKKSTSLLPVMHFLSAHPDPSTTYKGRYKIRDMIFYNFAKFCHLVIVIDWDVRNLDGPKIDNFKRLAAASY